MSNLDTQADCFKSKRGWRGLGCQPMSAAAVSFKGVRALTSSQRHTSTRRQMKVGHITPSRAERHPPRAVYLPCEVCQLLRISRSTLLALCDLAEHPAARPANLRALESFLIGCHHRISHASLVVWLERNQKFQRDSA